MSEVLYLNKLYPLQDKVLRLFSAKGIRHYLTGGTALSRAYLHHRYSEDLGFFLNNDPGFETETDAAAELLRQNFTRIVIDNRQSGFLRLFVVADEINLKLDFVNDVAYHYNGFEKSVIYYKTDNPLNILSNKITALNRQAAKDMADLLSICRSFSFHWPEMIADAAQKDSWVNEVDVLAYIKTFDISRFMTDVHWVHPPDVKLVQPDIKKICYDIASGSFNSLCFSNK
jgi:hypothetical protein